MHTVLVVDDDEISRRTISTALAKHYNVLSAASGAEAVRLCEESREPIALLVADVLMPSEYGTEVARKLVLRCPELPVLFVSGSPLDVLVHDNILVPAEFADRVALFLQKPFRVDALFSKVREALDSAARGRSTTA